MSGGGAGPGGRGKGRSREPAPALELLRRIQTGDLNPRGLRPAERRVCVELLTGEGQSIHQIAMVLKSSERTIARDRREVREANAAVASPLFVAQTVGALIQSAQARAARLTRLASDVSLPGAVRVRAERGAWRTELEACRWLQSVGYLPLAAQPLRAHITHGLEGPGIEELSREVLEMEAAWSEVRPQDHATAAAMAALNRQLPGRADSAPAITPGSRTGSASGGGVGGDSGGSGGSGRTGGE